MKEYLKPNNDGTYSLLESDFVTFGCIEVPEGAEAYVWFNDTRHGSEFYKDDFKKWYDSYAELWENATFESLPNHCKILWKRKEPMTSENQIPVDHSELFKKIKSGEVKLDFSKSEGIENEEYDVVNKPKHYNSDPSGVQCIELTRCLSSDAANALKYIWRDGKKDEILQERKKAQWYVNDLIEYDVPIAIEGLGDTIEFEDKVKKVLATWSGWKYIFLNALYWNDKQEMKRAIDALVKEAEY